MITIDLSLFCQISCFMDNIVKMNIFTPTFLIFQNCIKISLLLLLFLESEKINFYLNSLEIQSTCFICYHVSNWLKVQTSTLLKHLSFTLPTNKTTVKCFLYIAEGDDRKIKLKGAWKSFIIFKLSYNWFPYSIQGI